MVLNLWAKNSMKYHRCILNISEAKNLIVDYRKKNRYFFILGKRKIQTVDQIREIKTMISKKGL